MSIKTNIFLFVSSESNEPVAYPLQNAIIYICVGESGVTAQRITFNEFIDNYAEESNVRFCVEIIDDEENTEKPLTFIEKLKEFFKGPISAIANMLRKLKDFFSRK